MVKNPSIFGVGIKSRSAAVTAQRRVNCYVDIQQEEDRARIAIYGIPGVSSFADLGSAPIRGIYSFGPYIYAVMRDSLFQIRNDGVSSVLGTLDTTEGRIYWANNNDYLMLVDGTSGYTYRESTATFAKITDAQFPSNVTSVAFLNGYFIVSQSGSEQFDISALDDPTSWSGTDFDLAYSDPDLLVRVFAHQGVLAMFGEKSLEYWGYTGSADFPFARIAASQYGWGLAARDSVATSESFAYALMQRREGGYGVCKITGGEPVLVSTPDHVSLLDAYAADSRINDAIGTGWSIAGHPMYQIHFPTVGATWVYDGRTGIWTERQSYGLTHFVGSCGTFHNGTGFFYWGDYNSGTIWKQTTPGIKGDNDLDWSDCVWIDGQDTNSNDRPVIFRLDSEHIHLQGNNRFVVDWLEFDMESGLGIQSGQGSDPLAMLQVSRDKGHSFTSEITQTLGKAGEYKDRVRFNRLGQARDMVVRFSIADPIPRVLTGEAIQIRGGTF